MKTLFLFILFILVLSVEPIMALEKNCHQQLGNGELLSNQFIGLAYEMSAPDGNEIDPERLEEAKRRLTVWLQGKRNAEAADAVMASADENHNGTISRGELNDFLYTISLGNGITRGYWVDGLLDYFSGGRSFATRSELIELLRLCELYE